MVLDKLNEKKLPIFLIFTVFLIYYHNKVCTSPSNHNSILFLELKIKLAESKKYE